MVADSRPPSKKNFQNRDKTFIIEKKLSESRKKLESTKIFHSQKKNEIEKKKFKSKKNILESRKIFQNRENSFRIEKLFVTRIERKNLWN